MVGQMYDGRTLAGPLAALVLCALLALCTGPSEEPDRPTSSPTPAANAVPFPAVTSTAVTILPDDTDRALVISTFTLSSTAFAQGEAIPTRYTCDGEDISPPMSWSDPPDGTKGLALICNDPDAPGGIWVHWVLSDIPAESRSIPEAVSADAQLPDGSRNGKNGWGKLGYGGPCPPSGTHRYVFKLYALDTTLDLPASAGKTEVEAAMENHVLAQAELMGTYQRQ